MHARESRRARGSDLSSAEVSRFSTRLCFVFPRVSVGASAGQRPLISLIRRRRRAESAERRGGRRNSARTRLALAHANRQLQYVKGLAFGPISELLYALSSRTPERLCTVNHPKKKKKTECFSLFTASRKNTASCKLMHCGTFHMFGRR